MTVHMIVYILQYYCYYYISHYVILIGRYLPSGWFARDPNTLRRVGHVLLHLPFATPRNPRQIILADDYFQLQKIPVDRITQVVIKSAEKLFGSMPFALPKAPPALSYILIRIERVILCFVL